MVRITINDDLKKQILSADGPVELRDSTGRLVGSVDFSQRVPDEVWAQFEELTDEEIERRCNEPGPRYSTQEVIQKLKELQ